MFTTIEAMRIVHALCVIERDKQQDAQSPDLRRAINRTSAVLIERSRLVETFAEDGPPTRSLCLV